MAEETTVWLDDFFKFLEDNSIDVKTIGVTEDNVLLWDE